MTLDPRTPVIVGAGQYLHRDGAVDGELRDPREPAELMEIAAQAASTDAGLGGLPSFDAVRVVNIIGWRYRNAPRFLAQRVGSPDAHLAETTAGGNSPQMLVNRTALDVLAGSVDVALLAGAEAFRTYMTARSTGQRLPWPKADDGDVPDRIGTPLDMNHPRERELEIFAPVQIYPMFETALRAEAGRSPEEHTAHLGRLWAGLSEVAAGNPHAWIRAAKTADEITTVGPDNRMIGMPYPKLMNSNSSVDMGAALIMCSAEAAERIGVPRDRWVFPLAGTDCHEHPFVSNRDTFSRTPAIELGARRALELAGRDIDDVEFIDLYSCFPSAVQLGARSIGIDPLERQWSRTGGLPFGGGPWNNYPMHAIATVVGELRGSPDASAFVWANGGYATKHSFGVYATAPPDGTFRHESPQNEIDALPRRDLAVGDDAAGTSEVEAYTVMFGRDGEPEKAIAACRLVDGRRAWALSDDDAVTSAMIDGEWVGRPVGIDADARLSV